MRLKVLRSVLACLLVIVSLSFASAAYAEDGSLPDPGITPDSPLYFLDVLGKQVAMFFTFGNEAKAAKALRYAGERLAEARAMASENRTREMERAADSYDGYMAQVRERLENRGVSDNICERVALAAGRHLEVLEKVREMAPPKAAGAIERAKTASMDGQAEALRSLARHRPDRAADIISDAFNGQIKRLTARLSDNVTSANITAEVAGALDYANRLAGLEDEMANLAGENGIDMSSVLERLRQSTSNRLQILNGVYDKVPENARTGIENAIGNSISRYEKSLEKLEKKTGSGGLPPVEVMGEPAGTAGNVTLSFSLDTGNGPVTASANRTEKAGHGKS